MNTVTFKRILERTAQRMSLHPETADGLSASERLEIAALIQERLDEAWGWAFWPDLMETEERTVLTDAVTGELYVPTTTAAWAVGTTYAVGDVVERWGLFYEAILAGAGQDPLTATTYWTAVAQTPIGTVPADGVTTNHPRASRTPWAWPCVATAGRIVLPDSSTPDTVWVRFRRMVPTVSGLDWDVSIGTYVAGDVRYYATTGECYRCVRPPPAGTLPTDTGYWQKGDLPACLARGLAFLAAADGRDAEDKVSARLEGRGYEALMNAALVELEQAGQPTRATR